MKKYNLLLLLFLQIALTYGQNSTKLCYFNEETAHFFIAPQTENSVRQGYVFVEADCVPSKQDSQKWEVYHFITDHDLSFFKSKDTLTSLYINGKPFTGYAQFSQTPKNWSVMYWLQFKEGLLEYADTLHQSVIPASYKPVLYLYPPHEQDVSVKLKLHEWEMIHPYPAYKDGWEVIASPDGTLQNKATGKSHYCLFWETAGQPLMKEIRTGFVVKGEETAAFLEEKLAELGLTEKEANEFIIFWLPQMEGNAYTLIHFAQEAYEKVVSLQISPKPETQIRVMMVWQALSAKKEIETQILPQKPVRKGFTAVEWGGAELLSAD